MNRMVRKIVLPVTFLFVIAGLALPARGQDRKKDKPAPPKQTKRPMEILVNVDFDIADYVSRAETMIARKNYADAIEILQVLLNRSEHCFLPTDDPRRFVPLSVKVNDMLGQLEPEGIKLYRSIHDHRAERIFRTASERCDMSSLRDIVNRYLYTSYGDDALNLLGGIMFDKGEFSQAAYYWGRIVSIFDGEDKPMLLARIAVAHHFAGEADRAVKTMKLLAEKHPQARAAIGSKEQNVAAFARQILSKPSPFSDSARVTGWPCLAGSPDSTAVMGPCKPVMDMRWSVPGGDLRGNPDVKAALGVTSVTFDMIPKSARVSLQDGQVKFTLWTGQGTYRKTIHPLVHPIVTGRTVLYRSDKGVIAHDLTTGKKLWQSIEFPVFRRMRKARFYLPAPVEERNLWTLTTGGGRVFAVGGFSPIGGLRMIKPHQQTSDTSVLAAFTLADQGRLSWQVGMGKGDTDVVRDGKFLTVPTYAAGRLYAVVKYKISQYLVCLNADNGAVVWESLIGHTPIRTIRINNDGAMAYMPDEGSSPAVANGRVFVVTNTGIIIAFEADTGRPAWAYQYKSVNPPILDPKRGVGSIVLITSPYQPNPVVVTGGQVICLPADSDKLLALRADTGKPLWSTDRRKLNNLTALGDSRLLLSGKGLAVIDATTGKEVWTSKKIDTILGRPAVMRDTILASGTGEIIQVSLKDFSVTRLPAKQPGAILGNLICVDGKLIAANTAGVSAYFRSAPNADR